MGGPEAKGKRKHGPLAVDSANPDTAKVSEPISSGVTVWGHPRGGVRSSVIVVTGRARPGPSYVWSVVPTVQIRALRQNWPAQAHSQVPRSQVWTRRSGI